MVSYYQLAVDNQEKGYADILTNPTFRKNRVKGVG